MFHTGPPVIKQLMQMVTMVPGQGGCLVPGSVLRLKKPAFISFTSLPAQHHSGDRGEGSNIGLQFIVLLPS